MDEVVRGHGIAVRPSGVLAQGEGVGGVAVRGGVVRGHPGYEVALRVLVQQTLEEIADDVESGGFLVELRIERGELVEQTVGERLVVRQCLAGDRVGSGGMDLPHRGDGQDRRQRLHGTGQRRARFLDLHGPLRWGECGSRHCRRAARDCRTARGTPIGRAPPLSDASQLAAGRTRHGAGVSGRDRVLSGHARNTQPGHPARSSSASAAIRSSSH